MRTRGLITGIAIIFFAVYLFGSYFSDFGLKEFYFIFLLFYIVGIGLVLEDIKNSITSLDLRFTDFIGQNFEADSLSRNNIGGSLKGLGNCVLDIRELLKSEENEPEDFEFEEDDIISILRQIRDSLSGINEALIENRHNS